MSFTQTLAGRTERERERERKREREKERARRASERARARASERTREGERDSGRSGKGGKRGHSFAPFIRQREDLERVPAGSTVGEREKERERERGCNVFLCCHCAQARAFGPQEQEM